MFAIQIAGEWLDLDGAKVRTRLNSPVFNADALVHSFTYPVAAPLTARNKRLLRHADRIANTSELETMECRLYVGGLYWRTGTLNVRGVKAGRYDLDVELPPADVVQQLRELDLQDMLLGGPYDLDPGFAPSLADVNAVYSARTGDIDATPFVFAPIRNTELLGSVGEFFGGNDPTVNDFGGVLNYYDANRTEPFLYYVDTSGLDYYVNVFTPMFYLLRVLQAMFAELGQVLDGDLNTDAEARRMVVVSNYLHTVVLETSAGPGNTFYNNGDTTLAPGDALPHISAIEFLVAVQQRLGGVFLFRASNRVELASLSGILAGGDPLDLTAYAVPDPDFAAEQGDGYTLQQEPEPLDETAEPEVDAIDRERILNTVATPADLAAIASPTVGDLALVSTTNMLWRFTAIGFGSTEWQEFAPYTFTHTEGDGDQQRSVGVSLSRMWRGTDTLEGSRSWTIPHVSMKGNNPVDVWHSLGVNQCTKLRLLYYRGMQQDSAGDTYPLATVGTQRHDGAAIAGATEFERIEGPGGIHAARWETWLGWLQQQRTVVLWARLPVHLLLQFDFGRKVRVGSLHYLVRGIDFEADQDGLALAKLDAVRV